MFGAEQSGRQGWRQSEGNQHRNADRKNDRQSILEEKPTDDPFHESYRNEHCQRRKRARQNCERHTFGCSVSCLGCISAFINIVLDRLDHHDGVVHQQANCHRERQQGDHVDGEIECCKSQECRNDRSRDCEKHDDGCAPTEQEQKCYCHNEHYRDEKIEQDIAYCLFDEARRIARDNQINPFGRGRLDFTDCGADLLRDCNGVFTALLAHFKNDAGFAVKLGIAGLVFDRIFDAADIADADSLAIWSESNRYPGELCRARRFGQGANSELPRPALRDQPASGKLRVFTLDGGEHVVCRYAARAHRSCIQPNAHFALAPSDKFD